LKLSEDLLNEIIDAMIAAENLPSDKMQKFLAKHSGKTEQIIRNHYSLRFAWAGHEGDPWEPPVGLRG